MDLVGIFRPSVFTCECTKNLLTADPKTGMSVYDGLKARWFGTVTHSNVDICWRKINIVATIAMILWSMTSLCYDWYAYCYDSSSFFLFSLRLLRLCSCVRSIFFIIAIHMSRVIVMYICITIIFISIRALRITINIAVVIIVKLLIGIISFKFIIWSILFVLLLVVLVLVSD